VTRSAQDDGSVDTEKGRTFNHRWSMEICIFNRGWSMEICTSNHRWFMEICIFNRRWSMEICIFNKTVILSGVPHRLIGSHGACSTQSKDLGGAHLARAVWSFSTTQAPNGS
jgi:hypothetical protein